MISRSILLAMIVAIVSASAQAAPLSSSLATPPNGFSFEGEWSCAGSFGNGKLHRSSYEGSNVLGGSWLQLQETDLEPAGYQALYLVGYDKAKNQVIEFDANNFGSAIYTSKGWENSTLTLTSVPDPDPKAVENRFVFRIADAAHFSVNWEVNRNSQWAVGDHLECSHEVHT
jgi:hypothetical protein